MCGKFSTPLAVYQSQLSLRLRLGEFISLSLPRGSERIQIDVELLLGLGLDRGGRLVLVRRLEEGAQRPVGGELRGPRRVEGARVALEVRLGHLGLGLGVGFGFGVGLGLELGLGLGLERGLGLGLGSGSGVGVGLGHRVELLARRLLRGVLAQLVADALVGRTEQQLHPLLVVRLALELTLLDRRAAHLGQG